MESGVLGPWGLRTRSDRVWIHAGTGNPEALDAYEALRGVQYNLINQSIIQSLFIPIVTGQL